MSIGIQYLILFLSNVSVASLFFFWLSYISINEEEKKEPYQTKIKRGQELFIHQGCKRELATHCSGTGKNLAVAVCCCLQCGQKVPHRPKKKKKAKTQNPKIGCTK
jgi:hypothetical protein